MALDRVPHGPGPGRDLRLLHGRPLAQAEPGTREQGQGQGAMKAANNNNMKNLIFIVFF